jgi:hypothetical protein
MLSASIERFRSIGVLFSDREIGSYEQALKNEKRHIGGA